MTWIDHPNAPAVGTALCRTDELALGEIREFCFGHGKASFRLLVTRLASDVRAYINLCPHFQIPMNRHGGGFLRVGEVLWCAQHAAQFRLDDGYCIDGPCHGASLQAVPLACYGDVIYVGHPPESQTCLPE